MIEGVVSTYEWPGVGGGKVTHRQTSLFSRHVYGPLVFQFLVPRSFAVPLRCGVQVSVLGPARVGDRGVRVKVAFISDEARVASKVVEGGHL